MDNITILGAGSSGLALIEEIRAKNTSCNIALMDKNNYSYSKSELISSPGDISKKIDLDEWTKMRGVEFVPAFVERINPRRRKIYFKEGEPRDFDNLIIASGLSSKKLPVKGEHREGFFYLSDIDIFKLRSLLRISKEACVYVSTWLGLRLAIALVGLGKEVSIVSADLNFLGEDKEKVVNALGAKNITLYLDAFIEEAVGEGVVKAAKLSPLMVFSCQLVFIDSGFVPNLKFFEDDIISEDNFFTNFENIYLLGDVNRKDISQEVFFRSSYEDVKGEAHIFAEFIATGVRPTFSKQVIVDNSVRINSEDILKEVESWQSGLV